MQIEVSNGELIDKLTILEIKLDKITDNDRLRNITKEWGILNEKAILIYQIFGDSKLYNVINQLEDINKQLWDVEDWIRDCEKEQRFDEEFIQLARSVYKLNDKRHQLKKEIDLLTKSNLSEEKLYSR
jgi:predicted nuclease with TOPRIM domain